jgi:hypothetical protein
MASVALVRVGRLAALEAISSMKRSSVLFSIAYCAHELSHLNFDSLKLSPNDPALVKIFPVLGILLVSISYLSSLAKILFFFSY